MRVASFRDDVLWAIAYQLGLDPAVSLLKNQAYALSSYINAWVRRLWDAADWPEWTVIARFSFEDSPPFDNIIAWNHPPIGQIAIPPSGPDQPAPGPAPLFLGKVLKVYLLDPTTTWAPVDVPFRLNYLGVHCGFEHGNSVWIKYVTRAPKFTATEWDSTVTYNKYDLAYSPLTGECYQSKSSNNLGHDPSQPGGTSGLLLNPGVEETPGTPDNPGLGATAKIMDIFAALPPAVNGGGVIPDPPPAGSVATIKVTAADGVTLLGSATHTASGSESLLAIFTTLQGLLASALTGFTVTLVTAPLKIRLQNSSDFMVVTGTITTAPGPTTLPLSVAQVQAYVPATSPVPGHGQQFQLTLTQEQVIPKATYQLTFTTVDSVEHVSIYTSLATDNAQQILSGLINGIITLQPTDNFFMGVQSTLDTVSPSATFTIDKTLGLVSMHAEIQQQGAAFWDLVPFPFALVDQVVRGAYADALKEGGQADKAAAEEQAVPTEEQVAEGKFTPPQYAPHTDQQNPSSRYAVK